MIVYKISKNCNFRGFIQYTETVIHVIFPPMDTTDFRKDFTILINENKETVLIKYKADDAKVQIPPEVVKISYGAFEGKQVEEIIFSDSVRIVGSYAFSGCTSLKKVTFNKGLEAIGLEAFSGCTSLSEVRLPESLAYISEQAFAGCTSLKETALPGNLVEIHRNSFDGTKDLLLQNPAYNVQNGIIFNANTKAILFACDKGIEEIIFPKNTKYIGGEAFKDCTSIKTADIPPTVEWIGEAAFSGCSSITEINITKSVKQIEQSAFSGCTSLVSFKIPKGMTVIKSMTFCQCTSLKDVQIPSSVKNIEENAFEFCTSLEKVIIPKWVELEESAFPQKTKTHRI